MAFLAGALVAVTVFAGGFALLLEARADDLLAGGGLAAVFLTGALVAGLVTFLTGLFWHWRQHL